MLLAFFNRLITNSIMWWALSTIILLWYLSPLLFNGGVFYVPIFDNLDSSVVWNKILAESGKIFASNDTIIPNMMNGLPRLSYSSEFSALLWLYYFFQPKTAFIINEVLIHLVAFSSMYIFLKNNIVDSKYYYKDLVIFSGTLYFSLLPYWSGAGLTIAVLPLVTHILIKFYKGNNSKLDWLLLLIIPFYSSLVFFYIFYFLFLSLFILKRLVFNRSFNLKFVLAIFLFGCMYLIVEYRLIDAVIFDNGFVSHRTEFEVFFASSLKEIYRVSIIFFLDGHRAHLSGLQIHYVLPIIIFSMILSLSKRRFTNQESLIIWSIMVATFLLGIWSTLLQTSYTLPFLGVFSVYLILIKKNKYISLLMIFQISISIFSGIFEYKGLHNIVDIFPIFREFNFMRIAFGHTFIWTILIVLSLQVIIRKLHFASIFIFIFILMQIVISFENSFYSKVPIRKSSSFDDYYAEKLFKKVAERIPENKEDIRIVSYGLEPAVSLYNGFYTTDGYSVNYPLEYKYLFREIIANYIDNRNNTEAKHIYDKWGGKVYILSTTVTMEYYLKGITVEVINFDTEALCSLGSKYLISSRKFSNSLNNKFTLIDSFNGSKNSWDIYLYSINCK